MTTKKETSKTEIAGETPKELTPVEAEPTVQALLQENEMLRSEIRMRSAIYAVEHRLKKVGARSPDLLIEAAKTGFQFDSEGELANAEALVAQLKRAYPEQFETGSSPGPIDAGAGKNNMRVMTRESLSRMSPAEIQKLDWAEVKAVLAH